ncbi:MAG: hypothetical protein MJ107_02880 [Lachnospiraceae bacterium]|nr:hypothetical protein [Lachnospiraceae bacterium]
MDSFIDKITHRFGTNDVIKANSEAEARELEAARAQMAEYDNLLSEMRRLNLKSVETNEVTNQLVAASIEKIEAIQVGQSKESGRDYRKEFDDITEALNDQQDFFHKESVRVYRNVQAAVVEELKLQTEALSVQNKELEKKIKGVKPIAIISLVFNGITMAAIVTYVILSIIGVSF